MSYHEKTSFAARGKWRGLLMELGLSDKTLSGRHVACPLCGGKDRFRFDDKGGNGSYICGQCGAGDGLKLAMGITGEDFLQVAQRVDAMVGNIRPDATLPKREMSEDERRATLMRVWQETVPLTPDTLAHRYLESRGVAEAIYPRALRYGASLRDGDGAVRPALVAMVGVYGSPKFCSMHRTFLRPDGRSKAEMDQPRKLMPGNLPECACVVLSQFNGGPLGIAEGIETAMSASILFEMPVWSAINTSLMAKWRPPETCTELVVFGDNDPAFGGAAAAYALAHRVAIERHIPVAVRIPDALGWDWNDVLLARERRTPPPIETRTTDRPC